MCMFIKGGISMKFNRISRMFIAFLLASGVELCLSTCTPCGEMMDSNMDEKSIYQAGEDSPEDYVYHADNEEEYHFCK